MMNDATDPDEVTDAERSLLGPLGAALGDDPLPGGIVERAEALVTWFGVDDELVALLEEQSEEMAGTRGGATGMSFATPDGTTEIEIGFDGPTVVGHVLIGAAVEVHLIDATGADVATTPIDELGRFDLAVNVQGPHRLRFIAGEGNTVVTDWFVL